MSKLADLGRVHIIGIGGAGMSGIARIMATRGVTVSGSDAKDSRRLAALSALGVHVWVGHDAQHVTADTVDTVVISTAIKDSNVELSEALTLGIPVLHRAEALAAITADFSSIAVAGTHGKTTTTSMLTVALQHCGADPSFAIGSELNESGSNAHVGSGELFVVEADESDGTFLKISPIAGIVTNVEADHLDHWGTVEAIEIAFDEFVAGISARGGTTAICIDDAGGRALFERSTAAGLSAHSYGVSEDAMTRIVSPGRHEWGWRFEIESNGSQVGPIELKVPGMHNTLNATAAFVTARELGFDAQDVSEGLELFSGTRRRFEFKGQVDGIRVYDDYAHHPTEIAATLKAARDVVGDGRVIVAFQAHHYYRTALFINEFGSALGLADVVVVLEVFAPGEKPIPGASGQTMAANVPLPPGQVIFEPSWSNVAGHLAERAQAGDIVMTLGAGDIGMLGPEVLSLLRERT